MKTSGIGEADAEDRPQNRKNQVILAHMKTRAGAFQNISIQNVSARGFRATMQEMPDVDAPIELRLANNQLITGAVRWVENGNFGVELDHPIDADFFAGLPKP